MKPVVRYYPSPHDRIEMGKGAIIAGGTVDHPSRLVVNKGSTVYTSPVIFIGKDGYFETMNTCYTPENGKKLVLHNES